MYLTLVNRGLSLVIVVIYYIMSYGNKGVGYHQFGFSLCLLLFLCLIWFGDQMGSFTGYIGRGGNIDVETPGWLVCTFGWILLIGIPLLLFFLNSG